MNRGLKSYTKQLTQELGSTGKAYVNINENDANMHMVLPLVKTVGLMPFEVNLIYTHQNRNVKDGLFGNGFKTDWYSELGYQADDMWLINADGSRDEYTDGTFNPETQLTLEQHRDMYGNTDSFFVKDKNGNKKSYALYLTGYPSTIYSKKGSISVDMTASVRTIDNHKGDIVTFTKGGNGLVREVCYKHNGTAMLMAIIGYDASDRITSIVYKKNNIKLAETKIIYTTSSIKIEDGVSGEFTVFNFFGNKINSYKDNYGRTTSITYAGKRSIVTDFTGEKAYVIFDENDLPSYEIDSRYNVIRYEYDKESKQSISQSEPIQTKYLDSSAIIKSLSEFTREGVSFLQVPFTDEIFNEILGAKVNMITNGTGKFTKEITVPNGLGSDNLTVAVFGKLLSGSAKLQVMTDNNFETVDFKKCGDNFDLLMLGINEQKSYKKIKLTITLTNATIYLGNIQIIKKNFGSFYQYDANGNLTKAGNKGSTEITYNGGNLPSRSIGVDSTMIEYEYDSKDNLKKATTAYGVTIENEYDVDNNPTKMKITNRDGKSIVTQKEYDSERRFVTKEIDSAGNATLMTYEADGNLKSVTDALGAVSELSYKDNGLISKLIAKKGNESVEAVYSYTDKNLLNTVTLSNGTKYEFIYNSQNWLTAVKFNGQTIFSFEYNETTGEIIKQVYGSGDSFSFAYKDGLIDTVSYKAAGAAEETRYYYGYDEQKRLVSVEDEIGNYNCYYTYDAEGRVKKTNINSSELSYSYDNLGNMNKLTAKKDGVKVFQTFDTVERSKGSNPDSLVHAFGYENLLTLFDNDAAIRSQKVGYSPLDDFKNLYREGIIPYARVSTTNLLKYVLGMSCYYPQECGFTAFWFKVDTLSRTAYLFTAKSQYNNSLVSAKIVNGKIEVRVADIKGNAQTVLISKKQIKSGWNFFALNIFNRYDGYGYPDVCEYSITLNEDTQVFKKQDPRINVDFGSNPLYCIGNNNSADDCLIGKIAALCIAPRKYMSYDNIQKYYRCSKDYLIDNQTVDESVQTVDFGLSSVYTVNSNIQNKFEIAPLHNSVLTLSDKKPVEFDLREVSSADKDRTFNFNKKIKRYAYVADGSMLKYDFGQSTSGTVMLRAYTDSYKDKQYYFECADDSGKTLGLYRNENSYLCIDCNGKEISTGYIVNNDEWYTIGLSFAVENDVYGSGGVLSLRVWLGGAVYNIQTDLVSFGALKVTVGRRTEKYDDLSSNIGITSNCYPLYGQIEMLAANTVFNELSTISTLDTEMFTLSKTNEYDELGLLRKINVHKSGSLILSNELEYKTNGENICEQVNSETIKFGNEKTIRSYATDALGRITNINDIKFGSHIYTYDYRGFLTKADDETFSYDKNGNITNYNGTVFSYDSVIKDKLVSVGGNAVTYANVASLNPTSWNGRSYGFEGRRLKSFSYNGKTCSYDYDDQSHRIWKSVNGVGTSYTYNGDKLIIEDGINGKLFFLYDENNELYGFVKDEKKYFYIKDITGTIYGIVNEVGELVGKYSYSTYGKCTILVDTDKIATINPFRFKCYYYDVESEMYYCHTRYYVPEWGRWLNADHCAYLQLDDINGMNLFAYCNNNPVMYDDPNGTKLRWWQKLLIAVAVVLVVVGASVITGGAAAVAAGMTGGLATVGGGVVGGGAAGIGAVVAGGAAVVTGVVAGGIAVSSIFYSKIDYHGEPNSTVGKGNSEGVYDNNGNLIYRKDYVGRPHFDKQTGQYVPTPHTHGYKWKFIKGLWHKISEFILPF